MTQNAHKAGLRMYSREPVNLSFGWDEVSVQTELEQLMNVSWFSYTSELVAGANEAGLSVVQAGLTFGLLFDMQELFVGVPNEFHNDDEMEIPVSRILHVRAQLGSLEAFRALVERELIAEAAIGMDGEARQWYEGINLATLSLWALEPVQITFLLERPDCSPSFPFWRLKGTEEAAIGWLRSLTPQELCLAHGLLKNVQWVTKALYSVADLEQGLEAVRLGASVPRWTPVAYHWLSLGMKVPGNLAVRNVHPAIISALRGRERVWGQALNLARAQVKTTGEESHVLLAATKLVAWFGERAPAVVRRLGGNWHRAGIDLPERVVDGTIARLAARAGSRARMISVTKLALHKAAIEKAGIDLLAGGGMQRALEFTASLRYEGQTHDAFAMVASAAQLDPALYLATEKRWVKQLAALKSQSVFPPQVEPERGLKLVQLDKTDPRAVFAGAFTECCQHPEGVGKTTAWHAHASPEGAIWAVFSPSGTMLAQAWIWRSLETLVLDSIEITLSVTDHVHFGPAVMKLFRKAAQFSVGRFGVERVLLGLGSASRLIDDEVSGEKRFLIDVKAPKKVYTDALYVCRFA